MTRLPLFQSEPVPGLSGLAGVTGPGAGDGVAVVVDLVVLGAKSDGKTQLITHVIRTLDAHPPRDLAGEERLQNEKILELVLNAKRPMPEANPDKRVRHYVFRVKTATLLESLGPLARLGLLLEAGFARLYGGLALAMVPVVAAAIAALRGGLDAVALTGAGAALVLGLAWAFSVARRDLVRAGDVELVFWDVAGEDVYSDRGAGPYHAFLAALVAARAAQRRDGRARGRDLRHALAPILVCNPLAVGRLADDSPYARLRMIVPTFAALHHPPPEVLVVVNRWVLARAICGAGDADADDLVAILPVAREAEAVAAGEGPKDPLPVVRRSVAQRHCIDAEPSRIGGTRFRTIHHEAGLDASAEERPWEGWDALPEAARARWAPPEVDGVRALIEYRYAEGPGALERESAAEVVAWLAGVLWHGRDVADVSDERARAAGRTDGAPAPGRGAPAPSVGPLWVAPPATGRVTSPPPPSTGRVAAPPPSVARAAPSSPAASPERAPERIPSAPPPGTPGTPGPLSARLTPPALEAWARRAAEADVDDPMTVMIPALPRRHPAATPTGATAAPPAANRGPPVAAPATAHPAPGVTYPAPVAPYVAPVAAAAPPPAAHAPGPSLGTPANPTIAVAVAPPPAPAARPAPAGGPPAAWASPVPGTAPPGPPSTGIGSEASPASSAPVSTLRGVGVTAPSSAPRAAAGGTAAAAGHAVVSAARPDAPTPDAADGPVAPQATADGPAAPQATADGAAAPEGAAEEAVPTVRMFAPLAEPASAERPTDPAEEPTATNATLFHTPAPPRGGFRSGT